VKWSEMFAYLGVGSVSESGAHKKERIFERFFGMCCVCLSEEGTKLER
jgi:hypothetical protein